MYLPDEKSIVANEYFREMLLNHNIVNYEMLENGGSNGIDFSSILILPNSVQSVKLKFYRVNNARGDRRFSIETIKRKSQNGILNEGDLLYISVYMDEYDQLSDCFAFVHMERNQSCCCHSHHILSKKKSHPKVTFHKTISASFPDLLHHADMPVLPDAAEPHTSC